MTDTPPQNGSRRVVDPPLNQLDQLRQPLTEGERRVLEWFLEVLPSSWEIYIQPHLNGLRPDFVLLHPQNGIAVYEVKDWDLKRMDYFVKEGDYGPKLMAKKDGKTFALGKSDPVAKIHQYKREIYELYVPSLEAGKGLASIVAGIIFTNASTQQAEDLLSPLREANGHDKYPRWYPVIGDDLIGDCSRKTLRALLSSASTWDHRMGKNEQVAAELRHWLVEPSFSANQRVPLAKIMTRDQLALCANKEGTQFRRLKGPAGSGKSLVLAGRAVELAKAGKRVLVVTYNITLINYLLDLAVQYAQSGKVRREITALNFHHWCQRVAFLAGQTDEYDQLWEGTSEDDDPSYILDTVLPGAAVGWAGELDDEDRWDAVLVDEGQDFKPLWWTALRAALPIDGSGEGMIVADRQQNIYGNQAWTDSEMSGAGFRGRWAVLERTYRMSPALCRLASDFVERYLPEAEDHRPVSPEGEFEFKTVLRWRQIGSEMDAAGACVESILDILQASDSDPVAVSDLVCIVDRDELGLSVVGELQALKIKVIHTFGRGESKRKIREDSRRKKLAFFMGDARVKVTTIQSFKGWESKALVLYLSSATKPKDYALTYAAITRLKRDDRGCYMTVICAAPELQEYGETWPI